ncbi:MAG: DUF1641 domain-containing protein [Terriglobia bacterium]
MAQPIAMHPPRPDPREELRSRVENLPIEHAEAVLAAFEVLQGLHDHGVLELLRGALGSSDKVLEIAVEAARTPESIRGIRNFLVLVKLLGTTDPELVGGLARSLPEAITLTKMGEAKPPGFWKLLKRFRGQDCRRGLLLISNLLGALGRNVSPSKG